MLNRNKVVLGFSGGVDSTTAALLLKEQGFEVIGFFFDISEQNSEAISSATKVSEQLGIKLIVKNVSDDFSKVVKSNFCNEYIKGRTPNPCIICNPNIKFKELLKIADEENAYYIATGHYAQIWKNPDNSKFYIKKAANLKKDQSYMMYRIGQEILSRLILPLGDIADKEDTRDIARSHNLINSEQKDSQEICFIEKDKDYVSFIKSSGYNIENGNFVNKDGHVLGCHSGLINYTIGQRKGLGITFGKPQYVIKIDSTKNEIVLGDNSDLFTEKVLSSENFFVDSISYDNTEVIAKIRYAAKGDIARIKVLENGKIETIFSKPQRAVTPGQSIVFYKDDLVIGGGFID